MLLFVLAVFVIAAFTLRLWLQAVLSGVPLSIFQIIGRPRRANCRLLGCLLFVPLSSLYAAEGTKDSAARPIVFRAVRCETNPIIFPGMPGLSGEEGAGSVRAAPLEVEDRPAGRRVFRELARQLQRGGVAEVHQAAGLSRRGQSGRRLLYRPHHDRFG